MDSNTCSCEQAQPAGSPPDPADDLAALAVAVDRPATQDLAGLPVEARSSRSWPGGGC